MNTADRTELLIDALKEMNQCPKLMAQLHSSEKFLVAMDTNHSLLDGL